MTDHDVRAYWDRSDVESMYDKHLLSAEIDLIRTRLPNGSRVLDAGCGEGEGTAAYATVPGATIVGADFSKTRLELARARVQTLQNVELREVDFTSVVDLGSTFDVVVSQRFIINILEWDAQQEVLQRLMSYLRPGGALLLLEGSTRGVEEVNRARALFGLSPIPVRWHNRFLDDDALVETMEAAGHSLREVDGLGAYHLLTRVVRPVFEEAVDWDNDFNRQAASAELAALSGIGARCSRLRLWVFQKR